MGSKILGSCLMVGAGTGGVMVGGALVCVCVCVQTVPMTTRGVAAGSSNCSEPA
jgi:hypothetical protein